MFISQFEFTSNALFYDFFPLQNRSSKKFQNEYYSIALTAYTSSRNFSGIIIFSTCFEYVSVHLRLGLIRRTMKITIGEVVGVKTKGKSPREVNMSWLIASRHMSSLMWSRLFDFTGIRGMKFPRRENPDAFSLRFEFCPFSFHEYFFVFR